MIMSSKLKGVFSGWFENETPDEHAAEPSQEGTDESETGSVTASDFRMESAGSGFALDFDLGAPDPEYIAVVMGRIEESNLSGMDYFELRSAVNKQMEKGVSKEDSFQSSFATLAAVDPKFTKALCLQSTDHYIKTIESLQSEFVSDSNETIRLMEQKILDLKKGYKALFDGLVESLGESSDLAGPLETVVDTPVQGIIARLEKQQKHRQAKMDQVCKIVKSQIESDKLIIQKF